MSPRNINITGKKIGKFTAIKFARKFYHKRGRFNFYWIYECECGNKEERRKGSLTNRSMCMECRSKKQSNQASNTFKIDGRSNEKLYSVFYAMKNRCSNKNYHSYHRYGERGICICPEWSDYTIFKNWSLQNGYKEGLTIDRINGDKNYSPDNCRWATMKVQSFNKTRTYKIMFRGKIRTLNEISLVVNKSRRFLNNLVLNGIDLDKTYPERGRVKLLNTL